MATNLGQRVHEAVRQARAEFPNKANRAWERHIRVEWGIAAPPPQRTSVELDRTLTSDIASALTPALEGFDLSGIDIPDPGLSLDRGFTWEGGTGLSLSEPPTSTPAWMTEGDSILFHEEFELYWPEGKKRYMEFDASLDKDGTSNSAELAVWNLSDEKLGAYYEALRQAGIGHEGEEMEMVEGFIPFMRVYAGYGDWCPLVFTGKIDKLPQTEWDGADKVTRFSLIDDEESRLPRWRCQHTFPPGTMLSEIVEELIDYLGIPLGEPVELGIDFPIKSGRSFGEDQTVRDVLRELAQETESVMYVANSKIFFVPIDFGFSTGLKLNKKTGLIFATTPIHYPRWGGTEELNFVALLNPMLTLDGLVHVEDAHFSGLVRIEAVHIKINRDDYYCDCRALLFDEEAAKEGREERAEAKVQSLNQARDLSEVFPLLRDGFSLTDYSHILEAPPTAPVGIPQWGQPAGPQFRWNDTDGHWEEVEEGE